MFKITVFVLGLLSLLNSQSTIAASDNKAVVSGKVSAASPDVAQLKLIPPPDPIHAEDLVVFKIQTNGKQVLVKINSPNAKFRLDSGGGEFVVLFRVAGTYKVWAVTSLNDVLVETEISVEVVSDAPVPPNPPTDPLVKLLQDAYNDDVSVDKSNKMAGLVEALRAGADAAKTRQSNADVVNVVTNATKSLVGDSLPGIRKAIGQYLSNVLPVDVQNLTDVLRLKYQNEYTKVANALDKVMK